MKRMPLFVILLSAALTLAACGDDSRGMMTPDSSVTVDSSTPDSSTMPDAAGDTGGSMCAAPEAPYGVEIGRNFEPFTLNDCSGNPYEFYGPDFCDARFTVVSIAAGWCGPCIMESRVLESAINEIYGPQGVRVLQIITQTEEYGAPDEAYCSGWVSTYGLSNVELIDPAQITGVYFPGNALPATLIVDSNGVIVFREYGYSGSMLGSLAAELDELLAE
jgi:hypothetical protein